VLAKNRSRISIRRTMENTISTVSKKVGSFQSALLRSVQYDFLFKLTPLSVLLRQGPQYVHSRSHHLTEYIGSYHNVTKNGEIAIANDIMTVYSEGGHIFVHIFSHNLPLSTLFVSLKLP
jgi:hypothetical protein